MAYLYGKRWTRKQLSERIGDVSQIAVARPFQFADGRAKGLDAIEFGTGSGFRFTVLPGRGMDIGALVSQHQVVSYGRAEGFKPDSFVGACITFASQTFTLRK